MQNPHHAHRPDRTIDLLLSALSAAVVTGLEILRGSH
jgi:hypothetical protein